MTIRYLALLTICVAIALLSIPRSEDFILVHTGRDLDIAIVGRGYLCLVDSETAELYYTRNGNLAVDLNGQLAVTIEGSQWLIDPPIQIPFDWERIAVLPDGRVQSLQAGIWSDAGELQLAVFVPTPAFDAPLIANGYSDAAGPPTQYAPGNVAGVLVYWWVVCLPRFPRSSQAK
jgi:flagellar basal body rod protein FlgG